MKRKQCIGLKQKYSNIKGVKKRAKEHKGKPYCHCQKPSHNVKY